MWFVLIFGQFELARAQSNPFRELRDGDCRFITKHEDLASQRFIDRKTAIPVVRAYFENYQFNRFNKSDFFVKIENEKFFLNSVKLCQRTLKNIAHSCIQVVKQDLVINLRQEKVIDDVVFLLLKNHLAHPYRISTKDKKHNNKKSLSLDLNALEQKYFFIELKRVEVNPQTANTEFSFNPMATKEFKGKYANYKKLTPRQRLYLNYSHEQIIKLAEIIKYASQVMNSKNIKIVFDEDGDGQEDLPAIEASYSEKYNLAIKLIKRELNREILSGVLIGKNPTFTDLLAASMEAGYFSPDELKIMLDFPELRDPKPDTWKKVGKVAWLITRAGIMAIPGFGTIAAIPIVLVEAIIEGTKKNGTVDTTDNLF